MTGTDAQDDDWYGAETATFGDRLSGAREALGLSQSDLAKRLGVKLKTVRGWENDQSEPRANKLQMVAGLLNVSIMWLLTGEGDGLDGPETTTEPATDIRQLLLDLRQARSDHARLLDDLGRLEKRLRAMLADREVP